jgi:hypothetical protein
VPHAWGCFHVSGLYKEKRLVAEMQSVREPLRYNENRPYRRAIVKIQGEERVPLQLGRRLTKGNRALVAGGQPQADEEETRDVHRDS